MELNKLVSQLKLRYRLLTQLVAALSFFPGMLAGYLWLPLFEHLEALYSRGTVGILFIAILVLQLACNITLVFFCYRYLLKRSIGISNMEYWELAWGRWYPATWYKR